MILLYIQLIMWDNFWDTYSIVEYNTIQIYFSYY